MKNLLELIEREKVFAVLRTEDIKQAEIAIDELIRAGVKLIEVTMTIPDVEKLIEKYSGNKDIVIGAGTVMSISEAEKVITAGAKFVVSPDSNFEILKLCKVKNILYAPGCGTVTEIVAALRKGAELIKVFPASSIGGPNFIKSVLAPLGKVRLMPTGGITIDNIKDYINAGAFAVGMSGMIDKESIKNYKSGETFKIAKKILEIL